MAKTPSIQLINALIGQLQASKGCRVQCYSIAKSMNILPSTLSKWTLGRTRLDQIEALLTLIRLLPDEERWIKEFRAALKVKEKKPTLPHKKNTPGKKSTVSH